MVDARWAQRRVRGADHDDPDPSRQPGHDYAELVGGPLNGLLLDLTGRSEADKSGAAALMIEIGAHDSGRTCYAPRTADPGTGTGSSTPPGGRFPADLGEALAGGAGKGGCCGAVLLTLTMWVVWHILAPGSMSAHSLR